MDAGNRVLAALLSSLAVLVFAAPAQAAKIDGKECASQVSKQTNPSTGKVTYVCRTVDGGIASGSTVEEKAKAPKKETPVDAAAAKTSK